MSEFFVFTVGINKELIVENEAKSKGLSPYCPKGRKMVRHARKQMMRIFPVISRYIFMEVHRDEDFQAVRSIDGVMNILSNNGKPVAIPLHEIEELKQRELAGEFNILPDTKKQKPRPGRSFDVLKNLLNPEAQIQL